VPFIPLEVFANNPITTVSSGGTTAPAGGTQETWTVASSASFPVVETGATQFHVADPALPSEIITVINISGVTWTVSRGAEGTAPAAHAAGFSVVQVVTAATLSAVQFHPWEFPVQLYNAQGDGKIGTGGTGTSGTSTFTDSGASFVNAAAPVGDVGKYIIINQGTGSATVVTNPFCGTITAVNSATSVTLSANLAANCASAPYIYGTDDSAAITAAVTAAAQWAVATGNYKAQVLFEPQLYMLGTLTQSVTYQWAPYNTGLNYSYNTHIPIPFEDQYARKLIIDLIGTGDASAPDFWGGTVPSIQGTCLVSAVFNSAQPDGTFGQMSVVGGPSTQANIGTGGISFAGYGNALVNVEGITVVTPFNSEQYGFDFRWLAQAHVDSSAAAAFAPVNYNAQTVGGTWLRSTNLPSNGVAVGLAMPLVGNNALALVGRFSAEGISTGLMISEHFTAQHIVNMYCKTGIQVVITTPAGSIVHGGTIQMWTCEGCDMGIVSNTAATTQYNLFIADADFEVMITGYVNDPNGNLNGVMYWHDLSTWTPAGAATVAYNWKIVNTRMPPGIWVANAGLSIPAPPAAPATNTAQQNNAYRDATVYASAATSITSFTVAATSAGLATSAVITVTHGANVAVPIRVPGGWWYKLTYSGTLTTTWLLD
jgi:hypothetical protein